MLNDILRVFFLALSLCRSHFVKDIFQGNIVSTAAREYPFDSNFAVAVFWMQCCSFTDNVMFLKGCLRRSEAAVIQSLLQKGWQKGISSCGTDCVGLKSAVDTEIAHKKHQRKKPLCCKHIITAEWRQLAT